MDLFVVLDGSSSIGLPNFDKMLDFIGKIVSNLKIGADDTRVGLVQFNQFYRLEFKLNQYSTKELMLKAVKRIGYLEGATSTGLAIKYVVEKQFVRANGARKDVPGVILVVTDGYSQDDVTLPSALARSKDIQMIAVGITDWVNKGQLLEIANGDPQRVILLEDFDSFNKILTTLLRQIKRAVNKTCYEIEFPASSSSQAPTTVSTLKPSTSVALLLQSSPQSTQFPNTTVAATSVTPLETSSQVTTSAVKNTTTGEEMLVKCDDGRMEILSALLTNREGWIYVKGHFDDPSCRWSLSDKNSSPLLKFDQCGMQRSRMSNPKGLAISTTIISMRHPQFLTKGDRAFKLQCFFMEADKSVTNNLDVSMLSTEFISKPAAMPVCKYSLRSDTLNGPAMRTSIIGSKVFHRWDCEIDEESSNIYGMKVHTCYVRNHLGNKKALIIDEEGCVVDKYLLNNLNYSTNLLTAYAEGSVFAFADSEDLSFDCQIALCFKLTEPSCQQITPPKCSDSKRGKRSQHGERPLQSVSESFDVFAESIMVDPLDSDRSRRQKSSISSIASESPKYCLTFPILLAVIFFISILCSCCLLSLSSLFCKHRVDKSTDAKSNLS